MVSNILKPINNCLSTITYYLEHGNLPQNMVLDCDLPKYRYPSNMSLGGVKLRPSPKLKVVHPGHVDPTRTASNTPRPLRTIMEAPEPEPDFNDRVLAIRDPKAIVVQAAISSFDNLTNKVQSEGLTKTRHPLFRRAQVELEKLAPFVEFDADPKVRALVAQALDRLRSALIEAGEHSGPRHAAHNDFGRVFALRAYDLGIASIGITQTKPSFRFTEGLDTVKAAPEGVSDLPNAPRFQMKDGSRVVPGQFRQYNHTDGSIQQIVSKVQLPSEMIAFVGQDPDDNLPYIQIGIMGPDNYNGRETNPDKLVYGRRWRVETAMPDYEIMQTVFAAARDALDHEIREMFVVEGRTPFSGHVDAEFMNKAIETETLQQRENPELQGIEDVQALLDTTNFAGRKIKVLEVERRRTGTLNVVFEAQGDHMKALELVDGKVFEARAETSDASGILHAMMEEFRRVGLRSLEESFSYEGETRFSRDRNVLSLGEISALSRNPKYLQGGPDEGIGYVMATEELRAPVLHPGPNTEAVLSRIEGHAPMLGIPPKAAAIEK